MPIGWTFRVDQIKVIARVNVAIYADWRDTEHSSKRSEKGDAEAANSKAYKHYQEKDQFIEQKAGISLEDLREENSNFGSTSTPWSKTKHCY